VLEHPDAKVVVFSQWRRMHELLVRRMAGKPFDHVLFHGGVDGSQRKALVDRFREDDRCRAFLATDAGGVGLNLQHASVVVKMDLPWNPAVLEQRIGRVHRLGQKQPVRVVNFVAEGTIEEGMLSVLKFKKSLFAGVLDGGEREVRHTHAADARLPAHHGGVAGDAPQGCHVETLLRHCSAPPREWRRREWNPRQHQGSGASFRNCRPSRQT
jgi:superfamily II DNA/RNA helicase